jgi:hypothetical protein
MDPSLLFHAQRGTLAKKRSCELMLLGSCPSTYQQQIRNFNSLMVDVSVPTINTLHGMPSLLHLSSAQSELEKEFVSSLILGDVTNCAYIVKVEAIH